jgi:hypothetical protein
LYGVKDEGLVAHLIDLVGLAKEPGWWEAYSEVDDEYATFIGLEAAATDIKQYISAAVPALLQTREYSAAYLRMISIGRHSAFSDHDVRKLLEIRDRRQSNLSRESLKYTVVIDESAVRRVVGSPEIMAAQLDRLQELAGGANLDLRLLPFAAGAHPGQEGNTFIIVSLPQEAVSDVVYIDSLAGQIFLDNPLDLQRYGRVFDHLWDLALDESSTIEALQGMALDLRSVAAN